MLDSLHHLKIKIIIWSSLDYNSCVRTMCSCICTSILAATLYEFYFPNCVAMDDIDSGRRRKIKMKN